jgi:CSLREA domain-containing protein
MNDSFSFVTHKPLIRSTHKEKKMSHKFIRYALVLLALLGALCLTADITRAAPQSKVFTVNNTDDSTDGNPGDGKCETVQGISACTLRAAVMEANAYPGADSIILQAGTTYLLTTHNVLRITESLTINGADASSTIIDGDGIESGDFQEYDRVFEVAYNLLNPVFVNISNVTIRNATTYGLGAGIYNRGKLTLTNTRVMDNFSAGGSEGGGIYNGGTLVLINSTVSNNLSTSNGGGLYNAGTVTLVNSTLSGNFAHDDGGGIYVAGGTVNLYNATIANNTANSQYNDVGDGGGIKQAAGIVNFKNTLIAGNVRVGKLLNLADDCHGTLNSQDYNLIETLGGCTINGTTTHNQTGVNPNLQALTNNGGQTETHALPGDSPAIDKGNPSGCLGPNNAPLTTDQRGYQRPAGAHCDIGAYEYEPPGGCAAKPAKPALAKPANDATLAKQQPTLKWKASQCADTYHVLVKQDAKKGTKADNAKNLTALKYKTKPLAQGHLYYWRVKACNAQGCIKSDWRTFTINP